MNTLQAVLLSVMILVTAILAVIAVFTEESDFKLPVFWIMAFIWMILGIFVPLRFETKEMNFPIAVLPDRVVALNSLGKTFYSSEEPFVIDAARGKTKAHFTVETGYGLFNQYNFAKFSLLGFTD